MRILHSKKLVFVSKPRCGSTSVRRILDAHLQEGDEYCDYAGQFRDLHPHMNAASIASYIDKKGEKSQAYTFFTVTRHPLEMLWSYFKFFEPDVNMIYNWDERHIEELMSFEVWLDMGCVGLGDSWKNFVPNSVKNSDLSPLSLDAHVLDQNSKVICPNVFKVEDRKSLLNFLSHHLNEEIKDIKVNQSKVMDVPVIDVNLMEKLHKVFASDFEMYDKPKGINL